MRLETGGQRAAKALVVAFAAAGMGATTIPVSAVDWDGNFPIDGDLDGKYSDGDNWDTNITPGSTDNVEFDVNDIYSVTLDQTNLEALSTTITNGNVTFLSDNGNGGTNWRPGTFGIEGASTEVSFFGLDFNNVNATTPSLNVTNGAFVNFTDTSVTVASMLYGIAGLGGSGKIDDSTITVDGSAGALSGTFAVRGTAPGLGVVDIFGGSTVVSDGLVVGNVTGSTGSLTISDGSTFDTGGLAIGGFANSGDGTVLVTGQNSRLTTSAGSNADVGQNTSPRTGSDQLTVAAGGTVEIGGTFDLFPTGEFINTGGTATFADTALLQSTFQQNNSTAPAGGSATTTFNGPTTLTAPAVFEVGGGQVEFNDTVEVFSAATITHTGGTISFNGATTLNPIELTTAGAWNVTDETEFARRLRIDGTPAAPAVLTVSGGELSNVDTTTASDLAVGFSGRGQLFLLQGGVADIYDDVIFGQNTGSEGFGTILGTNSRLEVTRNGSGSNLFVGFNGEAVVSVGQGGAIEVGNDLVIQSGNAGVGVDSRLLVGDGSASSSTDAVVVNVADNLLVGPAVSGGSTGELLLTKNADVNVTGQTRIRAGGIFKTTLDGTLTTTDLQTDLGSSITFEGGEVVVDGGLGQFNHGPLVVGTALTNDNTAALRAVNGGVLRTVADVEVAGGGNRAGILAINGLGSRFEHTVSTADTRVGVGGMGTLSVTNGGAAELGDTLVIGGGLGSSGLVSVVGENGGTASFLQLGGGTTTVDVHVGGNNSIGQLFVRDGGAFNTAGDLVLGQGTTSTQSSAQVLADGGGDVNLSTISVRSILASGAQSRIQSLDGALVAAAQSIVLNNNANLEIDGGIVLTPELVANTAVSRIDLLNGGILQTAAVTGDLTNEAGVLRPDAGTGLATNVIGDLNITGQYIQQADATLEIQLGGTTAGTQHDRLVADVVTLQAGTALDVQLVSGFIPTLGDSFEIVLANGVFGTFGTTAGLNLGGGLELDVDYGPDRITLEVIQALLAGDYNGNGTVDAADYTVWADNFGSMTLLDADGNGNGVVDAADYTIWADNFGATNASTQGFVLIPEPGSLAFLALGVPLLVRRRSAV